MSYRSPSSSGGGPSYSSSSSSSSSYASAAVKRRREKEDAEMYRQMRYSGLSLLCICIIVGLVACRHKRAVREAAEKGDAGADDDEEEAAQRRRDLHHHQPQQQQQQQPVLMLGGGGRGGLRRRGQQHQQQALVGVGGGGGGANLHPNPNLPLGETEREKSRRLRKASEEEALAQLRADKKRALEGEYSQWASEMVVEERGQRQKDDGDDDNGDSLTSGSSAAKAFLFACAAASASASSLSKVGAGGVADSINDHASRTADDSNDGTDTANDSPFPIPPSPVVVLADVVRAFRLKDVEQLSTIIEALRGQAVPLSTAGAASREGGHVATFDGIFNERGKFILLSDDMLQQLARFINGRGRVSLAEVTSEANRLL